MQRYARSQVPTILSVHENSDLFSVFLSTPVTVGESWLVSLSNKQFFALLNSDYLHCSAEHIGTHIIMSKLFQALATRWTALMAKQFSQSDRQLAASLLVVCTLAVAGALDFTWLTRHHPGDRAVFTASPFYRLT